MNIMNAYVQKTIDLIKEKYSDQPEFVQTVEEVFTSIAPVVDQHPEYEKADLLRRMAEPERIFTFRVVWKDDNGSLHTNTGYRCQFNGALGPYKGGLRFRNNVNLSVIKFLGFEQTFKNALTGQPIGGAKGGSDFDPTGKSDSEIMAFCQSFMTALYRYIGPDIDVPAGDIGVGGREIGYLYGQYRRLKGTYENGVLTGKGLSYGGSLIRPEATGYGAVYYLEEVLKHFGDSIEGKRIAVSGYGNVAWGIMKKAEQLGAKVTYMSGSAGYIHDPEGIMGEEKLQFILDLRSSNSKDLKSYADRFHCEFYPNETFWGADDVDIYMPSATQNEVGLEEAEKIVKSGAKYYLEVSNMPTSNEAIAYLKDNGVIVAPSKAVNAGGVGVSALEMAQNSQRMRWSEEDVDRKLHEMMKDIYDSSVKACEKYGLGYDLIAGANIAGFEKVAEAMLEQGEF